MTTIIAIHEVEDGEQWARAWRKKGAGSRQELMAKAGATARTFHDPQNPNLTGFIIEVSDMTKFQAFMQSDESRQAMAEDRVKPETFRILDEFTP